MFLCTFKKGMYQWLFERKHVNTALKFSRDIFYLKYFQQWTKCEFESQITCIQMMAWENFWPKFTLGLLEKTKVVYQSAVLVCIFSKLGKKRKSNNLCFLDMAVFMRVCVHPCDLAFISSATLPKPCKVPEQALVTHSFRCPWVI